MKYVYIGTALCLLGVWSLVLVWYSFHMGQAIERNSVVSMEQTNHCYDTPKYEAWVAKKEGMMRCFMEHREYPHRVRASHID